MFKIKDRLLLGAISGTLSSAAAKMINRINYEKGLTDIRYNPMAAELFLPKKLSKSSEGTLIGSIVNYINVSVNGIVLTYLLSATGKDYKIFKGMGTGALSWVLVDGVMGGQMLKIKSRKPLGPAVHLLEHLFYGALMATLITKLGDESLFPPKVKKPLERNPLVHIGMNQAVEPRETNPSPYMVNYANNKQNENPYNLQ